MESDKIQKIKAAVKRNFDSSPDNYDEFESKYGFFQDLNAFLLKAVNPQATNRILDIGCGTGASSMQLAKAFPTACVVGLDNSPAMLEKARDNCKSFQGLAFIEGDASALKDCIDEPFDIIIYSASIFLIPDFRESLLQAIDLLRPDGRIGLTFMDGVYSDRGENVFAAAEEKTRLGLSLKKPVSLNDLQDCMKSLCKSVRMTQANFEQPKQQLRDFFSIQAMSAGLFPTLDYNGRLEKIDKLFENIPNENLTFRWMIVVGAKS